MMGLSDSNLIKSILKGEQKHFALLMSRYKDYTYIMAYRMMGNKMEAEEVCQDSFFKAYKNLSSYKQEAKFSTWLYTIVYRCCVDRLNKRKKELEDFNTYQGETDAEQHFSKNEANLEDQDRKNTIDEVLNSLDADSKAILTLHYLKELSLKEIEQIMGLKESNAKVKLFRARKKFEEKLRKVTSINEIAEYGGQG